jgi:RimJ/RimL family protein N-acetyltransferase
LHLTIKHKQDKRLVGYIILCGIENKNESLEFRRIFVNEKGKGFGREAIKLLKKICFDYLKFNRLWLDVHIDNLMAIQLYESENFRREGTLREAVLIESAYKSIYIYSMLKHEYDRA